MNENLDNPLDPIEVTIDRDRGGYYVEWFDTETEESVRWYAGPTGTWADCISRCSRSPPVTGWSRYTGEGGLPHDAATATGMYDKE